MEIVKALLTDYVTLLSVHMACEQRYYVVSELRDTEEEDQEEENKTVLDILNDYEDYPAFGIECVASS